MASSPRRSEVSGRRGARFSPPIGKLFLRPTSSPFEVATVRRLLTYYVLVVIELSPRKVHIAGITPGPDGAFMMQVGRIAESERLRLKVCFVGQ